MNRGAHERSWSFLTNHGHVLLALHRDPNLRQRDIAYIVGMTEGAVHSILADLQECGYVTAAKVGRRNRYAVDLSLEMRHPLEAGHAVGDLLELLVPVSDDGLDELPSPAP